MMENTEQELYDLFYDILSSELNEARSNPALNPRTTTLEELKKINFRENKNNDVFVTMTMVDKFGMNPSSKYDTPLGIYSYPLKYVIDKNIGGLPFVKDAPFIQVFRATDITKVKDLHRFQDRIFAATDEYYNLPAGSTASSIIRRPRCPHSAIPCTPYNVVWYTMYKMIKGLEKSHQGLAARKILLKAGVTSLYDEDGEGIIHPNEPVQAVFLDKTKLTLIDRLDNDLQRKDSAHSRFIKRIQSGLNSETLRSNLSGMIDSIIKTKLNKDEADIVRRAFKSNNPELSLEASKLLGITVPELESNIAKKGSTAFKYAMHYRTKFYNTQGFKLGEKAIATECSPSEILNYVRFVRCGKEFIQGEKVLATEAEVALDYALEIGRRFRLAESVIFAMDERKDAAQLLSSRLTRLDQMREKYFERYFTSPGDANKLFDACPRWARFNANDWNRYRKLKLRLKVPFLPALDRWLEKRDPSQTKAAMEYIHKIMPGTKTKLPVEPDSGSSFVILLNMVGAISELRNYIGFANEIEIKPGLSLLRGIAMVNPKAKEIINHYKQ